MPRPPEGGDLGLAPNQLHGGENLPQPLGGATSELSERGGKLTRESSLGAKSLDSMRQAPRYAEKGSVPGPKLQTWESGTRARPVRGASLCEKAMPLNFCFAPAFLTY